MNQQRFSDDLKVEKKAISLCGRKIVPWRKGGKPWERLLWETTVQAHGREKVTARAGDLVEEIKFSEKPLWQETWLATSLESLKRSAKLTKHFRGWLDFGSH